MGSVLRVEETVATAFGAVGAGAVEIKGKR